MSLTRLFTEGLEPESGRPLVRFSLIGGNPLRLGHQTCYRPFKAQRNGFKEKAGQTGTR
jgi:hypothetical protein